MEKTIKFRLESKLEGMKEFEGFYEFGKALEQKGFVQRNFECKPDFEDYTFLISQSYKKGKVVFDIKLYHKENCYIELIFEDGHGANEVDDIVAILEKCLEKESKSSNDKWVREDNKET